MISGISNGISSGVYQLMKVISLWIGYKRVLSLGLRGLVGTDHLVTQYGLALVGTLVQSVTLLLLAQVSLKAEGTCY